MFFQEALEDKRWGELWGKNNRRGPDGGRAGLNASEVL
jgi:hypothetical protein